LLENATISVKPLHHLSHRQNSTYDPSREEPSVTAAPKKNQCCVLRQQRRGRKLDTAMKQPHSHVRLAKSPQPTLPRIGDHVPSRKQGG